MKSALIFVATLALPLFARDPEALKSDLSTLLPQGQKMRLAYLKGGVMADFPFQTSNTAVYVVDSDDGISRKLWPSGTGTGNYFNVRISADGSRVVFYDNGRGEAVVVRWDGTLERKISINGRMEDYFRNPADNSDWIVVYYQQEGGSVKLVNISNPTASPIMLISSGAGDDCVAISDDGKRVVAYYDGAYKLWNVDTKSWLSGSSAGCQPSFRAGMPYQYAHNIPPEHNGVRVFNGSGELVTHYKTTELVGTWINQNTAQRKITCQIDDEIDFSSESTRFTNHRDFATFMAGHSKVNPYLLRVTDMKFIYIEDNLTCNYCGDMDMAMLPVGMKTSPHIQKSPLVAKDGREKWFTIDGRNMGTTSGLSNKRPRGIHLVMSNNRLVLNAAIKVD